MINIKEILEGPFCIPCYTDKDVNTVLEILGKYNILWLDGNLPLDWRAFNVPVSLVVEKTNPHNNRRLCIGSIEFDFNGYKKISMSLLMAAHNISNGSLGPYCDKCGEIMKSLFTSCYCPICEVKSENDC